MKKKVFSILALLLMAVTGAQADTEADGGTTTITSDRSDNYIYIYDGTLVINQGVTFTCNSAYFKIKGNGSKVELHGTLTGNVSTSNWTSGVINVYLSDGAKYTVTGLNPPNESDLRYYGYDAATDGNGTVTVKNGSTDVTSTSTGYKTTTYTFTANPSSGYKFKNWTKGAGGEVLGTDASINVTCEQNGQYQVYANFEEDAAVDLTLSEATDNSTTLTTNDGQVANVTLTRTLQTGGWNTFCVPFSIATPTGWTVKELTASSFDSGTGALSLTFGNAASIVAGTPYLVKVAANVDNPTFDGVTISKDAAPVSTTAIDFVPTLGLTEISGDANDILFLSSGNTLLHPSSLPANMKGFRAYFLLKGEAALARSFSMDFGDGETTGIITIENGQSATGKAIYDLQGRRVNGTAQKGVYIVNGKKTVIK